MEMNNEIYGVALDIGASKVSLMVGSQQKEGRIRIVAGTTVDVQEGAIRRGEIENIKEVSNAIEEAIQTIEKEDGIRIHSATISISGLYVESEEVSDGVYVKYDDEITQEDIDALNETITYHRPDDDDKFVIETILDQYIVNGKTYLKSPLGMSGNRLRGRFNILYGSSQLLKRVNRTVTRSELSVSGMVPIALATAEAVLTDEDKELGVCIIDLGATTTEIAIFQDYKLRFIKTLPFGMSLLNEDIKSYSIAQRFVEQLKVQYGEALSNYAPDNVAIDIPSLSRNDNYIPQRTLAKIIESRLVEIIIAIKNVIAESGYDDLSEGIVLTGGGAKLKNIDKLFKNQTHLLTRIGIPSYRVDGIDNDIINDTRYSTVIGTLLKAFEQNFKSDIEFIEQVQEEEPTTTEVTEDNHTYEEGTMQFGDEYDDTYDNYESERYTEKKSRFKGISNIFGKLKDNGKQIKEFDFDETYDATPKRQQSHIDEDVDSEPKNREPQTKPKSTIDNFLDKLINQD